MSSSSAGSGTNTTYLPLSDSRCNSIACLAFKAAGDASQAEIPFASQFAYGHYVVYYYCSFIAFFGILYWYRRLSAKYVAYSEPQTTVFQKSKAVWRFIFYRKLGIGMSVGHALFIGVAILFMTILAIMQGPYFRPRLSYGSPPLGVRTGVMALSLTPAIVALSGKFNFITLVTGISYERLNELHRYVGYICLGLGIVHSVTFGAAYWGDENYWPLWEKIGATEYTGAGVLLLLLFLTMFSIPWFRLRFYEAFACSHVAAYLVYLGFMFWHTANRIDTWMYLYATVAISVISSLGRLLLRIKTPRWSGSTATIQDIDGEMLKITIPAFNGMLWKPGQHVYLRFPGISRMQNHPFTIASLCEETYVTDKSGVSTRSPLLFLVRPRKGLTRQLMKIAQQRRTLKVFVDGPYGGSQLNLSRRYEQIILVAGGSGISAVLPLLSILCKEIGGVSSTVRSVRLIWIIKSHHAQSWVQDDLKSALAMARPGVVEIDLYITGEQNRSEQLAFSFAADGVEMEASIHDSRSSVEEKDEEEEQLIPKSADISDWREGDVDECLSLDDLEMEIGMDGTSRPDVDVDDEDEKLIHSRWPESPHQQRSRHFDYGIEASMSYGRPNFQDVLPKSLWGGGRICVVGCGPQGMNIDLSNAVAACQTGVLRGRVREIKLWTETFGW